MQVSVRLREAGDAEGPVVGHAQRCDLSIGQHCLIIEPDGNDFVIRYHLNRPEGPQPEDREVLIRGITYGRKDQVSIMERAIR